MPSSSHIAAFVDASRHDPENALRNLRRELDRSRGPLVEAVQGTHDVLVTFVYIGPAKRVVLKCPLLLPPKAGNLDVALERVDGSDVWFASTLAAPDISIPYSFQVDRAELTVEDVIAAQSDPARLLDEARSDIAACLRDSFNPDSISPLLAAAVEPEREVPPEQWESILTLPGAAPFPYDLDGILVGSLETRVLHGASLPGERKVSVYLPPGHAAAAGLPVLVFLDGDLCLRVGKLHHLLDAAVAAGDLPPVAAVFWHNLTPMSRTTEMVCNPALAADLADMLLPWLHANYDFSTDSQKVILTGMSLGGLAALHSAFTRPDAFGGVIAFSPALGVAPDAHDPGEGEATEWLTHQYVTNPQKQLRLWVGVGSLEVTPVRPDGSSMVTFARRFYDATSTAGYDVRGFTLCPGGHDVIIVRRWLVDAVLAVLDDGAHL